MKEDELDDRACAKLYLAITSKNPSFERHMKAMKRHKLKRADKDREQRRAAYAAMTEEQKEARRRKERERRFANRLKISAQRREKYRTDPAHRAKVREWNAAYKAKKTKETGK